MTIALQVKWEMIERPGYLGKKRKEIESKWDYELETWRLVWQWGDSLLLKPIALQIYEDAYYEFLNSKPELLKWLVETASDVYDTAPSNVESRLNYNAQETPNNHLHDIAIRRAVLRNGAEFKGNHLVEVRKPGSEGESLAPYAVPFHLPQMIYQGDDIKDYGNKGFWWRELGKQKGIEHTVEEFYQQNKVLQRTLGFETVKI
ncbi:hypothetical protein HYT25_00465 [Candidatus Pacearchaeota archaeon]|nr:hypothetical protein [Candidatus Pacearchaeota archaeon]